MPVTVGFAEPDTIVMHATGVVSYPDGQHAIARLRAHPAFPRARVILVDASRVSGAPSAAELKLVAREYKPIIESGLSTMAIVSDQLFVYGVARMFATFSEVFGLNAQVFRSMPDAEQWLHARRDAPGPPTP